jgi:hypothetical protein
MGATSRGVFALAILLLVTPPRSGRADEVPDPCKLLSASEMSGTLGVAGPVEIEPNPIAPPVATVRVVDRGGGNIGVAVPINSGPRKNTLVCGGRVGSVKLAIEVTSIPQAEADQEDSRQQLALVQRKRAVKLERLSYGTTTCEELLEPAADMLGREPQPNNPVLNRMRCYTDSNGWQVAITAVPWTPQKNPPFSTDKLGRLADLAAKHMLQGPPSPEQNVPEASHGVPAGFMQ